MNSFSKSTILGLAFGIFLAGYAVFAFTPPTAGPPNGNVPTPINTGPVAQVKSGGLWVGSLGVDGGATIGGSLTASGQSVCLANGTNCPPGGVPAGFVGYFNLSSCPSGWSALTAAQGRYLVGGGTVGATVGTALSDQENRAVGQHNHTVNDPGHSHPSLSVVNPSGNLTGWYRQDGLSWSPPNNANTGISINTTGSVAGTNAPYLQLLVCQKS